MAGETKTPPPAIKGKWRITSMDLWDQDFLDLVAPSSMEFKAKGQGAFGFGCVEGWLDCRYSVCNGVQQVEFSWEGEDEGDERCGRGYASIRPDGSLVGRFFFDMGDDSGFVAARM